MDKKTAAVLLSSLLERVNQEKTLGVVSSLERQALGMAVAALGGPVTGLPAEAAIVGTQAAPAATPAPSPAQAAPYAEPIVVDPDRVAPVTPPDVHVALKLQAVQRSEPTDPGVLLCLDFGTAMSKAFAAAPREEHLDLALGEVVGHRGYALPSSVFISNDGRAYFGQEAIDQSLELVEAGRERQDSIKSWLSLRTKGDLDSEGCVLGQAVNPTATKLTQGDLVRIYLAYLTDVACLALENWEIGDEGLQRYVRRRFARPCWPDTRQAEWADALMRTMLAEAQVLADTFSGRWVGGIPVAELKAAVDQVKALPEKPTYLIETGVPEPVAVAAGALDEEGQFRDVYMVVDVGAGTTDFGLFIATRLEDTQPVRVFQVAASVQGLMQAGDRVDGLLRGFIVKKESFDTADNAGRLNVADLARKSRNLKELLFTTGLASYVLPDGTRGQVTLDEFLADEGVRRFSQAVEDGFKASLEAIDESWLTFLAKTGNKLRVVLTGGSSQLPMMRSLAEGSILVRGKYRIERERVDPRPAWMEDSPEEFVAVYPQLAVAIGGAAEELPQTLTAPEAFGGGTARTSYRVDRFPISGT